MFTFLSLHRSVLALRPSQQSSCARAKQGYTGLANIYITLKDDVTPALYVKPHQVLTREEKGSI